MKAKTIGNIILGFSIFWAVAFSIFYQPIAQLIFQPDESSYFYNSTLFRLFLIACAIMGVMARQALCKNEDYKISKASSIAIALMCIVILLLPFTNFTARTQVTSESITEFSATGRKTSVHEIKDAEYIDVNLYYYKHTYHIDYQIFFKDGYDVLLMNDASPQWWNTIYEIDLNAKKLGIKKHSNAANLLDNELNEPLDFSKNQEKALEILDLE
ncbi:MAG: hypothetical protein NC110_04375 [Ruminococcus sp.]|nr:hypothetical protein [Ruminococcus sp.]